MDIAITEEDDTTVEFDLTDATPAFANALRRTLIADVPVLAIEDVHVADNNSGVFDEILAHRLGLLPWTFDPDAYEIPEDDEEVDPRNTLHMALQAEGPGTVTADDITVPDADVEPAQPDAVVVDLHEDGRIDLEAEAVLGRGKDHAKWQAANAAYAYDEDDDTFHFTVESVSGLDPRTLVSAAVDRLEERVDAFADAVDAQA